ncbi:MAG: PAS domain S-box protein, partial [Bacteroidia bacterium]|nr:PAS domain S-box protein [Bacteroidia bacterium]
MHRLLKRQINKLFGDNTKFSDDLLAFIELINSSYQSFQNDFNQLERTLELSSKESFKELSDFQSAVDTAAIVSVTDTKGVILIANQNFSNISGYSISELVGSNHSIVNSGYHTTSFFEKMWNTIKGGEVWQGQIKNKKKDGSFYWTNTNIIPLINDQGFAYQFVAIRFDITERKIAEEKLIQSEKNLAEILAAINRTTASIEFTPEGIITEANQLFLDLVGYKKEEIIGKQHVIFVDESEENYKEFWTEIGNGKIVGGEYKRVKKNGEPIWIIGNYNPVLDENNNVKHIIKFVVDITDRKLAENNLVDNERLLKAINKASSMLLTNIDFDEAIINSLACIGSEVNVDSVYIYENHISKSNKLVMSQRYEWLVDNNRGEINNPKIQNVSYFESGFDRWFKQLSVGKSIKGLVNDFPEKERISLASKNIISLIAVPIFISDIFWGFIGFDCYSYNKNWSITDENILRTFANNIGGALKRNKAEKKLIESEGKFRLLIESATDMFYYTNNTGQFTYVNEIATKVTGFSIHELLEKRYIDLVRPDFKNKVEAFYLNQAHKDDNVTYLEFPIITKLGFEIWIGQNVQLIYKDGNFSGVQAIARDITALKKAQFDLINSKNFLNNILNAIPNPVFVKNKKHQWVLVNDAYANLLNLKKEAIIGKTDLEFLPNEEAEYFINKDNKLFDSKIEDSYETDFVKEQETKKLFIKKSHFSTDDSKEFLVGVITDITEIKNQQNEIFLLTKITEQISDAISVVDYSGKMIYVNDSMAKAIGKTKEEMIGSTVMEMEKKFPTVSDWILHFDEVKEKGELLIQGINVRKDGSEFPVEASVKYIKVDDQEFTVAAVRDITDRKKAQEEVENLKSFYEKILNKIPADIVVFDKQHKYLFINPLSIKNDELRTWLIGKDDYDYCEYRDRPKELADTRRLLFNEVFEGKVQYEFEESVTNEIGEKVWMLRRMFPVLNSNDEVENIIGFGLDITDRKLAEIKILKAQGELEEAQHIAKVGGWEIDRETRSITWTNEMYVIHELPLNYEPTIATSYDFYTDETRSLVVEKFKTAIDNMEEFELEAKIKTAKGNIVEIRTKGVPLIENNKVKGLRGIFQDITQEKEAERQMKEYSEELEMKNKELDQFAYIVSHDLKAPLRGINNLSLWIEEDLGDKIEGEIKASFDMMRGRVKRMELLINGILEYSRAGRVKQQAETFELKLMLDELVEALCPAEKFKISIPADLPIITAERISFEQIFTNYISNGIKYNNNPEPTITVSYKINNGMYEFCVADNGAGIDKQYHEKVFVIFQTLQSRDTYESTGVGLAIVKKIVEDKGGSVWIESEKGFGAKF